MDAKDKKRPTSIYDNIWGTKIPKYGLYFLVLIVLFIILANYMGWFTENDPIEPIIK